ncbi:aldo/keto reductase [Leifsonia shinshuensis]|uniref:aldo/keto reductase n=1 Tax=Leifsonia shinshuensis TaxID=150026 RepID=UPI001F5132E8|nr:aldo/keto reductase [Leifsonia shinshuensis]MCI0158760.1 aldo/keto reductase [Leifsonia shinshuensis]
MSPEVGPPRVGLGCAQLGNLYTAMSDETALACVETAWDAGVRYFDTAPHYGLGLSERRLGAALRGRPRDAFTVSTKVGRLLERNLHPTGRDTEGFEVPDDLVRRWDFSAAGITASVAGSQERLGLDRIDILLAHDPDLRPATHAQFLAEGAPALEALRAVGRVGAVGVGTNSAEAAYEYVTSADLDVVMIAGRFNLLDHSALDGLLDECARRGISVVNVGAFASGVLANPTPSAASHFRYELASPEVLARVSAIAGVCAAFGTTLPRVALAFAASHPAVASVTLGASRPEHVRRNVQLAASPQPPAGVWGALAEAGLLDAEVVERLRLGSPG